MSVALRIASSCPVNAANGENCAARSDMDICVSEKLAAELDLASCPRDKDGCYVPFEDVQMKADMEGRAYDIIDGYRCQTLEDILKAGAARARAAAAATMEKVRAAVGL